MAYLVKEYKFVKQENIEDFFKAVGINDEQVSKIGDVKPSTKLVKNGDTYTNFSTTPRGTRETSFKSGVEFDDVIMGKIPVKSTYNVDGNKITQVVKRDNKQSILTREYNGDELIMTITSSDYNGVAKIWFKA